MAERAEMRTKVEQRQMELELALSVTLGNSHEEERGNGLRAELRVAADVLQGGWEHVSEAGAVTLSKWLESTHQFVIPPKHAAKPAEPKAEHKAKEHAAKEPKAHEAKEHKRDHHAKEHKA